MRFLAVISGYESVFTEVSMRYLTILSGFKRFKRFVAVLSDYESVFSNSDAVSCISKQFQAVFSNSKRL